MRLTQGRADQETRYSDDPVAVAAGFQREGAVWIHVVDLFAPACKQVTPVRINWMTTVINVFLVAALAITVWIFERQK